jgi:hypothetical protein
MISISFYRIPIKAYSTCKNPIDLSKYSKDELIQALKIRKDRSYLHCTPSSPLYALVEQKFNLLPYDLQVCTNYELINHIKANYYKE